MSVDKLSAFKIFRGLRVHFISMSFNASKNWVRLPKNITENDLNVYGHLGTLFYDKNELMEFLVCVMSRTDISHPAIIINGIDFYRGIFNEWKKRKLKGSSGLIEEFSCMMENIHDRGISLKHYMYMGFIYEDLINLKISLELFIVLNTIFKIQEISPSSSNVIFSLYHVKALKKYSLLFNPDMEFLKENILKIVKKMLTSE